MGFGLDEASAFLLSMKNDATTPAMSGFYIPAQALSYATGKGDGPAAIPGEVRDLLGGVDTDQLKKLAAAFVSPDGHAARYLIQTKFNPFSTAAMDQINAITAAAQGAQPNTALADARVSVVGLPVFVKETRDYYGHDLRFIIVMTICVVLLILIALLRAIVAPLYLIGSVIISYMSALGIGVIVFQFILGGEMHWSVPGLTFVILVAVGADYNMLLISRLRDESKVGIRSGVIRTVGSTGGVITAAGLIMAASMFGLVFASLSNVVQSGFVLGTGLLLDTFLLRTVTVPAIAVLLGRANWWRPPRRGLSDWWPLRRQRGRTYAAKRKPLLPESEKSETCRPGRTATRSVSRCMTGCDSSHWRANWRANRRADVGAGRLLLATQQPAELWQDPPALADFGAGKGVSGQVADGESARGRVDAAQSGLDRESYCGGDGGDMGDGVDELDRTVRRPRVIGPVDQRPQGRVDRT